METIIPIGTAIGLTATTGLSMKTAVSGCRQGGMILINPGSSAGGLSFKTENTLNFKKENFPT